MSQPKAAAVGSGTWLPLVEYSIKSGLSLSTIRRKIKSNALPFRLEKGKYFLLFSSEGATAAPEAPVEIPRATFVAPVAPRMPEPPAPMRHAASDDSELQAKEERIQFLERRNLELEDQLQELRLLVKVLEEKYEVSY